MNVRRIAIVLVACGLSGCFGFFGLAGKATRAKTTSLPATQENWAKLEGAATQLGWTYKRGKPGGSEWLLTVEPAGGGVIEMDDGADGKHIRYVCDGKIKDSDKCKEKVNELFRRAFNAEVR